MFYQHSNLLGPRVIIALPCASILLLGICWCDPGMSCRWLFRGEVVFFVDAGTNKIILDTGPHNLRSFLTANSTQNHFLIARMLSFLWHSQQKWHIKHFATKWDNSFYRKWIEGEEIKKKWENVESETLSISSFSLHSLFIFSFSLHFLTARLPGWHKLCHCHCLVHLCSS